MRASCRPRRCSLNGCGIATFSDRARDRIRGGGPFDGGISLQQNQGFITGLFYDDNGTGGERPWPTCSRLATW